MLKAVSLLTFGTPEATSTEDSRDRMNILLQSHAQVEQFFGRKSTMAHDLFGLNLQGEKAFDFSAFGANEGYRITVGFINDIARYIAFKRVSPGQWIEADIRTNLMLIGAWSLWKSKPGSDYFDYEEHTGDNLVVFATGWQTPKKKYSFCYVPVVPGELNFAPDKAALDRKL